MILISSVKSIAQQNSWEGTDFVFTQPVSSYSLLNIKVCSKDEIEGTISFNDTIISFNNSLNKCASISIEKILFKKSLKKGINLTSAIQVNTNKPSTVYVTIFNTAEDEGYNVLPTHVLGKEYSDVNFDNIVIDTLTYHTIIATENNTQVDVILFNGNTTKYVLNSKDVLVLKRLPVFDIISNNPVAVFTSVRSAIKGSNCNGCCTEDLYEQALPKNYLGKTFILNKIHSNNESIILINSIEDNTCLEINGTNYSLEKNENLRYYTKDKCIIRSSTNIMAYRIFESNACMNDLLGDPELFQLSPIENLTKSAIFFPPHGYFQKKFLNIIIPKESLDSIYLDSVNIKDKFLPLNEFYYSSEFEITQETHSLSAKYGFQAFAYSISNSLAGPNSAGYNIGGLSFNKPYQFKTAESFNLVNLCDNETFSYFNSDTFSVYTWNDGYINRDRIFTDSGVYILQVTNTCLNYKYSDTIIINKLNCICTPKVPDIFSPNNDGINDVLKIEFDCSLSSNFKLQVFNRWGILIYENDNYKNNWDGKDLNNLECVDGVYIFTISYNDEFQNRKNSKGIVCLIK